MGDSLGHVIEVGVGSVADILALPVGKGIGKAVREISAL